MHFARLIRFATTAAAILLACSLAYATDIVVPVGLAPGSTYQLIFVTAGTFAATSGTISDYNADVTAQAALNATLAAFDTANSVTWTVVGSTQAVGVTTNSPSTGSVYTLDGVQVASAAQQLYSGTLLAPLDIDQNGNTLSTYVWTGITETGAGGPCSSFCNQLGDTFPFSGNSTLVSGWASGGANGAESVNPSSLYAISSVLTVPQPPGTPEPASIALLCSASLAFFAIRRRTAARTTK